jgi:hypothetical protein
LCVRQNSSNTKSNNKVAQKKKEAPKGANEGKGAKRPATKRHNATCIINMTAVLPAPLQHNRLGGKAGRKSEEGRVS